MSDSTDNVEMVEVRADDLRRILDELNLWSPDRATRDALQRLLVAIGQGVEG